MTSRSTKAEWHSHYDRISKGLVAGMQIVEGRSRGDSALFRSLSAHGQEPEVPRGQDLSASCLGRWQEGHGDRGMISSASITALRAENFGWITALKSGHIRTLVRRGAAPDGTV